MTGPELAALRESLGLSQARFADYLGIYQSTLIKWEKRDKLPLRIERFVLAVAACKVFMDFRQRRLADDPSLPIDWLDRVANLCRAMPWRSR